ncbi:hypothetical protein ACFL37_01045 [Candidatus Margulisiibacteriota bacterium]
MSEEKTATQKLEELLKGFWKKTGNPHIIAARHTEFVVEPMVFLGDKLNPQILKLLVVNYLTQTSAQDSGTGNIDVTPDKLVIKNSEGKPLVMVRDKKLIQQYLSQQA